MRKNITGIDCAGLEVPKMTETLLKMPGQNLFQPLSSSLPWSV